MTYKGSTEATRRACRKWRKRHPEKQKAACDRWKERNPQKVQDLIIRSRSRRTFMARVRKYGMSEGEMAKFLETNMVCAIDGCGQPSQHVDHNHETGIVRGMLCAKCNLMLGHARDNPELLEAAAVYLRTAEL